MTTPVSEKVQIESSNAGFSFEKNTIDYLRYAYEQVDPERLKSFGSVQGAAVIEDKLKKLFSGQLIGEEEEKYRKLGEAAILLQSKYLP